MNLQPASILDVRIRVPGDSPSAFPLFVCSACRQSLFLSCARRALWLRLSSEAQLQDAPGAPESPCVRLLAAMERGALSAARVGAEFFVYLVLVGVDRQNPRRRVWALGLESLCKRYKVWLLSKFKKNLEALRKDPRLEDFSREKLTCLAIFCAHSKIKFHSLKFSSNLPPSLVYRNVKKKRVFGAKGLRGLAEPLRRPPAKTALENPAKEPRRKTQKPRGGPRHSGLLAVDSKALATQRIAAEELRRAPAEVLGGKARRRFQIGEEDSSYAQGKLVCKEQTARKGSAEDAKLGEVRRPRLIRVDDLRPAQPRDSAPNARAKDTEINLTGQSSANSVDSPHIEIEIESGDAQSSRANSPGKPFGPESPGEGHLGKRRVEEALAEGKGAARQVEGASDREGELRRGKLERYKEVSRAVSDLIRNLEACRLRLAEPKGLAESPPAPGFPQTGFSAKKGGDGVSSFKKVKRSSPEQISAERFLKLIEDASADFESRVCGPVMLKGGVPE